MPAIRRNFLGSRAFAALLLAPAFVVGQWLIMRNALINTHSVLDPALVIRMRPVSERALLIRVTQGVTFEQQVEGIKAAAEAAPISGGPYLAAARIFVKGGAASPDALPFLRAARDLSPRDPDIRLSLVDNFARAGAWEEAIDEADAAMRLDPQLADRLAPVIGMLARTPKARSHLATLVAAAPSWRERFLRVGPANGATADVVFRSLASLLGERASAAGAAQTNFIRGLIAQQRYDLAYLAFLNFLPENAVEKVRSVYDGRFERLPGPVPFNWNFFRSANGYAEIDQHRPGLIVGVSGFGSATLAQQTLALPAGAFRFEVKAALDPGIAPEAFVWTLTCLGSSRQLLDVDLASAAAGGMATTFAVPATGCPLQQLRLASTFRDGGGDAQARIGSVDIVPAGSDE